LDASAKSGSNGEGQKMNLRIAAVIALIVLSVFVLVATASIEKNMPEIADDNSPKPTPSESAHPATSSAYQIETPDESLMPSFTENLSSRSTSISAKFNSCPGRTRVSLTSGIRSNS
jgi:hypothetical protein